MSGRCGRATAPCAVRRRPPAQPRPRITDRLPARIWPCFVPFGTWSAPSPVPAPYPEPNPARIALSAASARAAEARGTGEQLLAPAASCSAARVPRVRTPQGLGTRGSPRTGAIRLPGHPATRAATRATRGDGRIPTPRLTCGARAVPSTGLKSRFRPEGFPPMNFSMVLVANRGGRGAGGTGSVGASKGAPRDTGANPNWCAQGALTLPHGCRSPSRTRSATSCASHGH